MNRIVCNILIIVGLSFLSACNHPQSEAHTLLAQAEQLMEEHSDSALLLVDSIFYPEKSFNENDIMCYNLIRVQARHKNFLPITEDTIIFDVKNYFTNHGRYPEKSALACYYCGWLYRERGNLDLAMLEYNEAKSYAEKTGNTPLKALIQFNIGAVFREHLLFSEALENYTLAKQLYIQSPGDYRDKQVYCDSEIGQMYLLLENRDSAFVYLHKGLDLAESIKNRELQRLLTQNLSVAYAEINRYEEASGYLHRAMELLDKDEELPLYYLNFSALYQKTGQTDSLSFYAEKLAQSVDSLSRLSSKISAYSILAEYAKDNDDYTLAFDYQKKINDLTIDLNEERFQQSILDVKQKYDYELLQKQYYMNLAARQQWILALLVAVLVGGILFTWYWFRQRNRKAEVQRNIDTLVSMNRELENTLSQNQLDLRRDLLWRFNVARKVLDMNEEISRAEKKSPDASFWVGRLNKIVYGEKDIEEEWDALFQTFNAARPGLAERIREKYPDMTDTEFRVCILLYAGFSVRETALILHLSPNTVQVRRTDIRRKMGLDAGSDIADHIDQLRT